MSHAPHHGRADDDAVRSLLSGLPDPGPMPADLVARIEARLAAERRAAGGARVLSLPTPERVPPSRRLVLALAGAVAATATIGVVGVDLLRENQAPPVLAALTAPLMRASNAPTTAAPRIHLSDTAYTRADLVEQATALRSTAEPTVAPLTGNAVGVGPLASPAGVASCLAEVGVRGASQVTADLATFDGRPAAVLVTTVGGHSQARVVPRTCGGGESTLYFGPVDVP